MTVNGVWFSGLPENRMKPLIERCATNLSNCQKRAVVCVLYNDTGQAIACGWNLCCPPDGVCPRIGVQQKKATYSNEGCQALHAEEGALGALYDANIERFILRLPAIKAVRADVYGHDFACPSCEQKLKQAGITTINIIPSGLGTGLRKVKSNV